MVIDYHPIKPMTSEFNTLNFKELMHQSFTRLLLGR